MCPSLFQNSWVFSASYERILEYRTPTAESFHLSRRLFVCLGAPLLRQCSGDSGTFERIFSGELVLSIGSRHFYRLQVISPRNSGSTRESFDNPLQTVWHGSHGSPRAIKNLTSEIFQSHGIRKTSFHFHQHIFQSSRNPSKNETKHAKHSSRMSTSVLLSTHHHENLSSNTSSQRDDKKASLFSSDQLSSVTRPSLIAVNHRSFLQSHDRRTKDKSLNTFSTQLDSHPRTIKSTMNHMHSNLVRTKIQSAQEGPEQKTWQCTLSPT